MECCASPAKKHGRSRCRARCASSRLRRLAPSGLPSFPRSARLTPQARIPRSGPARFACRAVGVWGRPLPCPAVFPDSITLSATVARGRVPSRRAGPCPRFAAGRTNPALASLTTPVRALLTVAGDELRKDGGNRANRVPRADRTEQPKGWAPNLGIRCALSSTAKSGERHACNPFRFRACPSLNWPRASSAWACCKT